MPIVKTDAFVLKSFKFRDTSKIVTLFTKELGKLSAIIKGVRKFNSGKCGVLETMNYINAVIYFKENRDLQFISSAEYKTSYPEIIKDLDRIKTTYRILDIVNKTIPENEKHYELFDLMKSCLETLNNSIYNCMLTYIFFQKELLIHLGIRPYNFEDSNEIETFLRNIELNQQKLLKDFLYLSDLKETKGIEIDPLDALKIADVLDRYILFNLHGVKKFDSRRIISELNQI